MHAYPAGTPVTVSQSRKLKDFEKRMSDQAIEKRRAELFVVINNDTEAAIPYAPGTVMLTLERVTCTEHGMVPIMVKIMTHDGQVAIVLTSRLKFLTGPGPRA